MVTVSRIVEKLVERKPFLQEFLRKGIVNYGALAEDLLPDIERELKKKVKPTAVMMALRRLNEKLERLPFKEIRFDESSNIIIREGLIEITVEKNKNTLEKIRYLFKKINYSKDDFLTITQGVYELTIITDRKNLKWISKTFHKSEIISIIKDLSALTLTIPIDFIETPGFFYLITRSLVWENINIEEIVSTARELTLIIKSEDVPNTFDVLKKLIEEKN